MSTLLLQFTVLAIFVVLPQVLGSELYYQDGTSERIITPRLRPGSSDFSVFASITVDTPFKLGRCKDEPNAVDAAGKIVLIQGEMECLRFFKKVRPLQQQGAVAILFARSKDDAGESGMYYYWTQCWNNDCEGIKIPLVEIDYHSAQSLNEKLSDGQNITIQITNDHNEYGEPVKYGAYYALTATTITLSLGIMCLAAYKLFQYVGAQGWSLTLNTMVFMLQITSAGIRIVWVIDPCGFYFVYPRYFTLITSTLHLVPYTASNLLLTCYWQESITSFQVMEKIPRLRKFKWPLIAFVIILLIADLTSGVLRAFGEREVFSLSLIVVSFFYSAVCIGCTAFFLVTAILLLQKLKAVTVHKLSGQISRKSLRKLSALIIIYAIGNLMLLVGAACFILLVQKAWLLFLFAFNQHLIVELLSIAQLMIFQTPTTNAKSTSSGSKTTDVKGLRDSISNIAEVPVLVNDHITDSKL